MIAFSAIVKLTCRSVIRSHVFQVLLGILLLTIISLPLTLQGDGTPLAYIQVSLRYCLGAVSFILSISTIWLSCFAMGTDIEKYQIHMIITKPVSRPLIWLAKCTGILLIHTILLLISVVLVYILILSQFQDQMFLKYTQTPLLVIMGIAGIIILFSLFSAILKMLPHTEIPDKIENPSSLLLWKLSLFSLLVLVVSLSAYFALYSQFNRDTFSEAEKIKIKNEVLVGRRVYMPLLPDMKKLVTNEFKRRMKALPPNRRRMTKQRQQKLKIEIYKQILSRLGEAKPGVPHFWSYEGLPPKVDAPIFLRYRAYLGKDPSRDQRETMGMWAAEMSITDQPRGKSATIPKKQTTRIVYASLTYYPQRIMTGVFHEAYLTPEIISRKGTAVIRFINFDPQRKTIFFQNADGPKLLIKISGFMGNYIRGIFIIFLKLLFLTALACAIGGVTSPPVAIFTIISYLLIGSFSSYLIGLDQKLMNMGGPSGHISFWDWLGSTLSNFLILFVIPMQNFEISEKLSSGELIELSTIGHLFVVNVILRGLPFVLLGIWLYKRREMGLTIKK